MNTNSNAVHLKNDLELSSPLTLQAGLHVPTFHSLLSVFDSQVGNAEINNSLFLFHLNRCGDLVVMIQVILVVSVHSMLLVGSFW